MKRSSVAVRIFRSRITFLVIFLTIFTVCFNVGTHGDFLEWTNIRFILSSMVISSYLTCGAALLMITGCLDLSASQTAAFSGFVLAKFLFIGLPWYGAIIASFVVAAVIGTINAFLIHEINIPPFVATLAMSYIITGAMLLLSRTGGGFVLDETILWIGSYKIGGEVPIYLLFTAIILAVYCVLLSKTKFGKKVYLTGGNPVAARLSGLNPRATHYVLYINNAILCACAGVLQAGRLGVGSMSGVSFGQFMGITCSILGGISFGGGRGNIAGAFVGLLLLTAVNNGLVLLNVSSYISSVISGVLLLVALSIELFGGVIKSWTLRVARKTARVFVKTI
ncbi:MAG: ABC transporter permease [Oscillospiraceae bacterium]|jgi:ribose/xylose/arabinose/galactoside ABC-type transport system permease subunit|nr:ABC transporter permease [Oscillospiraceae bacterium]